MTCPTCTHPRVTLIDGTETCSWSEAWRAETEARAVLAIPDKLARREFLRGAEENGRLVKRGVRHVRGEKACADLEALILAVWQTSRN